ncbi:DNA methyltransferase [Halogeometricum sp. S1BR25-6]|uniref:DNA methyltransferase n=1 Tax=Halogeometricum salsisoli TaxID=2950536 RepID=A0ABU2GJG1_9EURY|nr:DNA methyltransferase [Halogeometricum sp. S1BR25-6]MDS0300940.1 DNA methyltransferase [Halogeometricum sp. S1BR25-6]
MGGGTTLVEASRFGIESTGYDLNPVAWFITKKEIDAGKTNSQELQSAFDRVKDDVADDILQYYKTPCPNVDGEHDADVMYNFWVKEVNCVSCDSDVPLYRDFRIASGRYENDDKENVLCPDCESVILVDDWRGESTCAECGFEFNPEDGNVDYGDYICPACAQKYPVTDAIEDQGGFDLRLFAVEYYCPHCAEQGRTKSEVKGYKSAQAADHDLFEAAKTDWENADDLRQYIPDKPIRPGWSTDANQFEGSMSGNGNLPRHGYHDWTDMYNERQLLCISSLIKSISRIEKQNIKEYLFLSISGVMHYHSTFCSYNRGYNKIADTFKTNRMNPSLAPVENNVWGGEYGAGTFLSSFSMVQSAIEYARNPTERIIDNGETHETSHFSQPIGGSASVFQGDAKNIDGEDEYQAVITDPPYYNNVLYSELSDYFYVWLKPMLESEYECFRSEHTPRTDSIVVNPASNKDETDFEAELRQAFEKIRRALKDDGVLVFTYHHSGSESWGELLQALCNEEFEITATYPVQSDINKFTKGETVEFDIVIVARPTESRMPISWNTLRRNIHRAATQVQEKLEENRNLSSGDIGVIEMGQAFYEYSKHHNEVYRAGEIMSAKDVVDAIYGIIQSGNRGEEEVYIDLLEESRPTYSDLNKHLKRSDASEELMREMCLFRTDSTEFQLLNWRDEKRQAYAQSKVQEDNGDLTDLDKAHFLRYRYEQGKSTGEYLERWDITELQELCEGLAEATSDDTYLKMLGVDTTLDEYGDGS